MNITSSLILFVLTLALAPVALAQTPAPSLADLAKATTPARPATAPKVYSNKDLDSRPAPAAPLETAVASLPTTAVPPIAQKDLDQRAAYLRRRAQLQATLTADVEVLETTTRRVAYLLHMVTGLSLRNPHRAPYATELSALQPRFEELQRTVAADRKALHDWDVVNR